MRRPLILAATLLAAPAFAQDRALTVISWGGDFAAMQDRAMARPFAERTGTAVRFVDTDDPAGMIKLQVEAGNVTADVASVGQGAGLRLCEEGDAQPIDPAILVPPASGTVADDFLPRTLSECFVATDIYSTVIAYDADRLAAAPTSAADFFDLERFPGRRGLGRTPQFTMELALVGDGVPLDQVYDVLATPAGVERALARLDTIRDQIVWWEAGAQPIQLVADGEVAMTHAYNGRVFKAAQVDGLPLAILWDAQMLEVEGWVIPSGAPNPDAARAFVSFSTSPEVLARAAEILPYGPPRASAQAMVGEYAGDGVTQMGPHLPTSAQNMTNALFVDPEFWADHEPQLRERFTAWLGNE
ncbi:ABC transporter substrate-binding protein [Paracoccus luteus]|uniref:ABC transporter substrate-binding protein n=1 Tax=Paracoccus luteus TaxID=2508543 RepID=UPI0010703C97|nr:ABC transporter substrate-binding protein [Paracoccus luteus]